MKKLAVILAVLVLLSGAVAAQYHHPVYMVGGDWTTSTSTLYNRGIYKADHTGSTINVSLLVPLHYYCNAFIMDFDNKNVVVAMSGTTSTSSSYGTPRGGLFRYDVANKVFTRIYGYTQPSTMGYTTAYDVKVDHNGDYITNCYEYRRAYPSPEDRVWRIDRVSGQVTTLLASTCVGRPAYWRRQTCINIDTGHLLLPDSTSQTVGTQVHHPILELALDGPVCSWWYWSAPVGNWDTLSPSHYGTPQNHRNGHVEGPYREYAYQIRHGGSKTTLCRLGGFPPGITRFVGGVEFDLATAPSQTWIGTPNKSTSPYEMWLCRIDRAQCSTMTSALVWRGPYCHSRDFDFYRGRHIQTVRIAKHKWDVLLDCPQYPRKTYVLALSLSGVRPGIPLSDGRNINLEFDLLTFMSVNGLLGSMFNRGPLVLDANGWAKATIDSSSIGPLGCPLWLAMAVLDRQAPCGIAYLPDTYVMAL